MGRGAWKGGGLRRLKSTLFQIKATYAAVTQMMRDKRRRTNSRGKTMGDDVKQEPTNTICFARIPFDFQSLRTLQNCYSFRNERFICHPMLLHGLLALHDTCPPSLFLNIFCPSSLAILPNPDHRYERCPSTLRRVSSMGLKFTSSSSKNRTSAVLSTCHRSFRWWRYPLGIVSDAKEASQGPSQER